MTESTYVYVLFTSYYIDLSVSLMSLYFTRSENSRISPELHDMQVSILILALVSKFHVSRRCFSLVLAFGCYLSYPN